MPARGDRNRTGANTAAKTGEERALALRGHQADTYAVAGDAEEDSVDERERVALAARRDVTAQEGSSGFTEAVTSRFSGGEIARRLPGVSVEARHITDLVINWQTVPTGLGADGPLHQFVEHVETTRIWVDEALYVHSEDDLRPRTEEQERNLLDAYRLRQVKNDIGVTEQFLWAPLIVARRPNPVDRGQNLVLIRDLTTYQAAMKLRWKRVEAIVYPELADEDLRVIGLHLAMRGSAPSLEDLVRHLFELEMLDVQASVGRPRNGRARMTLADASRLLGCDQSYLARLAKYLKDEGLRRYVREGVASWVVIRARELLGTTAACNDALDIIQQQRLSRAQALTYLEEVAGHARAARQPTAPRAPLSAPPSSAALPRLADRTVDSGPLGRMQDAPLAPVLHAGAPGVSPAPTGEVATDAVRRMLYAAATTLDQHWVGLCAARGEQVANTLRAYLEGALETLG